MREEMEDLEVVEEAEAINLAVEEAHLMVVQVAHGEAVEEADIFLMEVVKEEMEEPMVGVAEEVHHYI